MGETDRRPIYVSGFVYFTRGAKTKGLPDYTKAEIVDIARGFTIRKDKGDLLPLCLYHEDSLVVGEIINLTAVTDGLYCSAVINRVKALRDFEDFHRCYDYSDDKFRKDPLYIWRVLCPQLSMCNSKILDGDNPDFVREISLVGTGARTGTCAKYTDALENVSGQ